MFNNADEFSNGEVSFYNSIKKYCNTIFDVGARLKPSWFPSSKKMNNKNNIIKLSTDISKFVVGNEGNVSEKIKDNFLIKASGTSLHTTSKKTLILCDLSTGKQLNNFKHKPSIEIGFHMLLLKHKHINFVAHSHPINTLKILCSDHIFEFSEQRLFPDQIVFNGHKSCVIEYENPGIDLMTKINFGITKFLNNYNYFPKLILLQNHGIICCGKTTDECMVASSICEKSAEIFIGSKTLGKCNFMSDSEIFKIKNDKNEIYRMELL